MLETTPVTMTGPAMENIFTHTPKIHPSRLNSKAGLAMELENPVMGTMEPAPAKAPILSYIPMPVKNEARKMRIIKVYVCMSLSSKAGNRAFSASKMPCPIVQIRPPTKNAQRSDGKNFVLGSLFSTYVQ